MNFKENISHKFLRWSLQLIGITNEKLEIAYDRSARTFIMWSKLLGMIQQKRLLNHWIWLHKQQDLILNIRLYWVWQWLKTVF